MKIDTFSRTVPQMVEESQNQKVQGSGVEGVSWTSSMGDHLHLRLSYCCCHCRFLFCASLFSFSPLPLSLAHVACGVPLPLPFSGAPPVLVCVPHLVSSIYWWCRVHCHCRQKTNIPFTICASGFPVFHRNERDPRDASPVTVRGWWRRSFNWGWFWLPYTRLWCRLLCRWEK